MELHNEINNQRDAIDSTAYIYFITHGNPTYVKLKNVTMKTYLCVIDQPEYNDQIMMCCSIYNDKPIPSQLNQLDIKLDLIKIIQPWYISTAKYPLSHFCMVLHSSNKYLRAMNNLSLLKLSDDKNDEVMFTLEKTNLGYYIKTTNTSANIYGDAGRYLYVTADGCVHVDGDKSIQTSLWSFEKINEPKKNIDTRSDYEKDIKKLECVKKTQSIFKNMMKFYTIQNVFFNVYMTTYINSNESYNTESRPISDTTIHLSQNKLMGTNDPTFFIITPIFLSNYVYISYNPMTSISDNLYFNLFTFPRNPEVYVGAPNCDWAKFYMIDKGNNTFMFQVFHKESDDDGNFGRYLCMREINDELKIMSNGKESEACSCWKIIVT